jgi:hypothetical protein
MPEEVHESSLIDDLQVEDCRKFFINKKLYSCFVSVEFRLEMSQITLFIQFIRKDTK